jgi:3-isopropylmalate/(R)-2-methylmalate dehydratase large subunit
VTGARTLFDKIWDAHVVADLGDGEVLLHVDRNLLHDLAGSTALSSADAKGRRVHSPNLNFATPDHAIGTEPVAGRRSRPEKIPDDLVHNLRTLSIKAGITLFDDGNVGQGIVHVIGPALGLSLPGTTIVCGDSHTCTHGALGALGWGIGSTDVEHVLATQTVVQRRPKQMAIRLVGERRHGASAKDVALALIGQFGSAAGAGYAVEYRGPALSTFNMEERFTLCNMTVELGARFGLMAPDETVFEYLQGRPFAPTSEEWDAARDQWSLLVSDPDARFDAELTFDVSHVHPQVTWGTAVDQTIAVTERIPSPSDEPDPVRRRAAEDALHYMDLRPGEPIAGTAIDWVFIGSCTNGRLTDLRRAAEVVAGRQVAQNVRAWVVPGSTAIRLQAEQEGLSEIFTRAGFEWREAGCSLCCAANGERIEPGRRCVSTSNRNFMGRQGPGSRTHLASPAIAAASAIAGRIASPEMLGA